METENVSALIVSLKDWETWIPVLIIALISGMLGGYAHKLTSPPEDKTSFLGYIVIGAVASLAILFVFTPLDGVKLIAESLAAGYGGKAVLNALEARVKTAIAQTEAAKAKEDGKKAIESGKEAVSLAQNLLQKSDILEKALMETKNQPRETILETFKSRFSENSFTYAVEPSGTLSEKLKHLENKLDFLGESLKK